MQYTTGIKSAMSIVSTVEKQTEVVAVARQVNSNVFFRSGSKKVNGIISGVELKSEDELFKTSATIIQGEWNALLTHKTGIILGKLLAEKLGLQINNSVNVLTSDGVSKNYMVSWAFLKAT
jgi:lipoprotein-releasing system permease protein